MTLSFKLAKNEDKAGIISTTRMEKGEFIKNISCDPKNPSDAATYYWDIYEDHKHDAWFIKPNWVCLLLGSWMLLYRRMYVWFFVFLVVFEQLVQLVVVAQGFDRGMAQAWSSFLSNALCCLLFNCLYVRFIERKYKYIGVHVRLLLPLAVLFECIFGALLFQLIGIELGYQPIIASIYYFLPCVVAYVIALYIIGLMDWLRRGRYSR